MTDLEPPGAAAPRRPPSNLTAQTASGLGWSYLSVATLVVANLAYTATISRLLGPVAFGLLAMANLVVLFVQYFARMGLASAMVQKPDLSDDEIRASSTVGIVIGLICMACIWVLAPAMGALFDAPTLPSIVRGLSVSCVFMGWSQTGNGLLRRHLRFRALSLVAVCSYVFAYLVVGVGLALLGAGLWSLVAASVASTAVQSVLQYALLRHPVRPALHWEPYRVVCGYGARLSGAYLMDYVGSNLDTLTVTRIASTAVLGQYSRAYYLVFQPLGNYVAQALSTVLFSMLSRVQQDLTRLRRAFLSVLSITSIVIFPMCAGMAVAADELVRVVLGPQWTLVPGLVPWFALAGGCHVASQMSQLLAEARAELNRSLAVQVVYLAALALLLLSAVPFRSHGVWVIAAAVAGAEVLRYLSYLRLTRRVLHLTFGELWQAHLPAAFASTGVALAVAAVRAPLAGHAPAILVLAAEICLGVLAVVLCIRFCPVPPFRRELRLRLDAAALLGASGGLRHRLARLVLGPEVPTPERGRP
ncbi:lipopolysaccharide biosynthesis protein [Pseudonocardia charpentierae]|uniref:Lipopolysaccharide biosynthesis protein n=1 Tax=Pseudonocardia charpentierae TaxID=3075545 RepID=A0ABU2NK15_9PSEU|nr:lipopolysaccharide biosynthesis protein [Pseudonocardia sp. DSM 45834]MDT0353773.1 lipopolysaccharide biosynthesis protein [Pseudonocardia sp. DSM 45834]